MRPRDTGPSAAPMERLDDSVSDRPNCRGTHFRFFASLSMLLRAKTKYLAFLEAPPLKEVTRFVLGNIERGYPQFVVLSDSTVAGWGDVIPNRTRVIYSHCGTLGIGLLPEFRGRGIGRQLMKQTMTQRLRLA
jgi:GNAT superfamily N-acetyltransferase